MTMVEVYLGDVEAVLGLVEAQIVGANAAVGTVLDVDKILLNSPEYVTFVIVGGASCGESVNTLKVPEAVERSVVACLDVARCEQKSGGERCQQAFYSQLLHTYFINPVLLIVICPPAL